MDCVGTSSTTSLRTRAVKKRRQTRAVWRCLSGILARMLRWHPSRVSHPMFTPTRSRTFACTPYADRQNKHLSKIAVPDGAHYVDAAHMQHTRAMPASQQGTAKCTFQKCT